MRSLKRADEFLNELVIQALAKEMKWRSAWATHEQIQAIQEQVKQRTGIHPDSTPLIRQLREGQGRRDAMFNQFSSQPAYFHRLGEAND